MKELIDKLERERDLTDAEFRLLLECDDADAVAYLAERAVAVRDARLLKKTLDEGGDPRRILSLKHVDDEDMAAAQP